MENQKMKNLNSTLRTFVFAIALALSAVACQPKNDPVDERQTQINQANASFARMTVLDQELAPYGVNVRTPGYGTYAISRKPLAELQILDTKLTEYVSVGSNALRISARLDVAYADRAGLAERVANARTLLNEVKKNLGLGTDSTGRFWTNYAECNSTHRQNLEIYGVRILYYNPQIDGPTLARLSRDRRREIAVRARRYHECERILSQGRAQIWEGSNYKSGSSKGYDVTGKAIDPLAPPSLEQRNLNSLMDSLKED